MTCQGPMASKGQSQDLNQVVGSRNTAGAGHRGEAEEHEVTRQQDRPSPVPVCHHRPYGTWWVLQPCCVCSAPLVKVLMKTWICWPPGSADAGIQSCLPCVVARLGLGHPLLCVALHICRTFSLTHPAGALNPRVGEAQRSRVRVQAPSRPRCACLCDGAGSVSRPGDSGMGGEGNPRGHC